MTKGIFIANSLPTPLLLIKVKDKDKDKDRYVYCKQLANSSSSHHTDSILSSTRWKGLKKI